MYGRKTKPRMFTLTWSPFCRSAGFWPGLMGSIWKTSCHWLYLSKSRN